MAKRFTDTNKWKDTWFQDLPSKYKLFWIYLLDECDPAGLWKPNMRLVQFQIGEPFEEAELRRVFAQRIEVTEEGYWFIRKFIEFQYGELSGTSKPHISVLKLLDKHKIKGYTKGIHTLKDKDKEKDKDKDTYENAEEFWQEVKTDSIFIERLQRMVISNGFRACTPDNILTAVYKFIAKESAKPGFTDIPRQELKNYLVNWINKLPTDQMK
jgi:hypothetical protein